MALPSAAELVAKYLRTNGYDKSLDAFLDEAGLPPDTGSGSFDGNITIEKVLQEKKTFDVSLSFEKLGVSDDKSWNSNVAPSKGSAIACLPAQSNVLNITMDTLATTMDSNAPNKPCLFVSGADRTLSLIDARDLSLEKSFKDLQKVPILTWKALDSQRALCGGMSGQLSVVNLINGSIQQTRQDHLKYIVRIATWSSAQSLYIASAGWDNKVNIYVVPISALNEEDPLKNPVATIKTPSNPEMVLFVTHPDTSEPVLLITRRDSTSISYYSLQKPSADSASHSINLLGTQNLAPHSNAWIAFSPSCIAISPVDPYTAAVATSQTPHMKLLVVRLLIPPINRPIESQATDGRLTQASQARAELAVADREEAAIIISTNTMATQTSYSTPWVVWRPDGTGVWVNSDDGVIRGVETSTGKVVAHLKEHTPNVRIRCLWAGYIPTSEASDEQTEVLVSGGFDQKLIMWK